MMKMMVMMALVIMFLVVTMIMLLLEKLKIKPFIFFAIMANFFDTVIVTSSPA